MKVQPPADQWSLAIDSARLDPRLSGLDLGACDLNGDGFIAGDAEDTALADAIQGVANLYPGAADVMATATSELARAPGYYTTKGKALRAAGYTAMGLSAAAIVLAPMIGLAPAAMLFPLG